MRLRFILAVIIASLGGCLVICALMPWGDPCSTHGYSGGLCPIVLSVLQQNLRNAALVLICIVIGTAAGMTTGPLRYIAGAVSTPMAAILGGITSHYLYAAGTPLFRTDIPGTLIHDLLGLVCLAFLGVLGAFISRWLPNFRWSGHAAQLR